MLNIFRWKNLLQIKEEEIYYQRSLISCSDFSGKSLSTIRAEIDWICFNYLNLDCNLIETYPVKLNLLHFTLPNRIKPKSITFSWSVIVLNCYFRCFTIDTIYSLILRWESNSTFCSEPLSQFLLLPFYLNIIYLSNNFTLCLFYGPSSWSSTLIFWPLSIKIYRDFDKYLCRKWRERWFFSKHHKSIAVKHFPIFFHQRKCVFCILYSLLSCHLLLSPCNCSFYSSILLFW